MDILIQNFRFVINYWITEVFNFLFDKHGLFYFLFGVIVLIFVIKALKYMLSLKV